VALGLNPGEFGAPGRRQLVPRGERVDDRPPGRMGERPDVPRIVQMQRGLVTGPDLAGPGLTFAGRSFGSHGLED
jgi:hypothetical protein